jgi:hypothetical protein
MPVILLPSLSDDEAKKRFPRGWTAPRPYLRIIDEPKPPDKLPEAHIEPITCAPRLLHALKDRSHRYGSLSSHASRDNQAAGGFGPGARVAITNCVVASLTNASCLFSTTLRTTATSHGLAASGRPR